MIKLCQKLKPTHSSEIEISPVRYQEAAMPMAGRHVVNTVMQVGALPTLHLSFSYKHWCKHAPTCGHAHLRLQGQMQLRHLESLHLLLLLSSALLPQHRALLDLTAQIRKG